MNPRSQSWVSFVLGDNAAVESGYNSGMPEPVRVYVVDDEPVIATTLAAILNASGFRAIAFIDAEMAFRAAESDCPSVLIADVVMPEMNGIELAIRIKSFCPNCKVLLLSGNTSTFGLLDTATKQGYAFDILAKPAHPEYLLAAIRKL